MSDIECVFESMTGKGSIFISNYAAAQDISLLQAKGIRAVLSVARSGLVQHSREEIPFYLYLPAEDHEEYELYKFFNQTFDFIEQARRHCNVLVHCMAGISRSVTIVIAYLLKKFKCSLGEVIMMLQRRRSKINPNKGFIEQLKKYAQQEGLKCNFDYEEVPSFRERSCSRGKQSKSKEKGSGQYGLANPLVKRCQEKGDKKRGEKTAASKQDISEIFKKNEEADKEAALLPSPPKPQKAESVLVGSPEKPFESNTSPLRKQCSFDSKASPQKKKMSIEEKITKVREKMQQKEELRRQSVEKQPSSKEPTDKENKALNLRATLQTKKGSSKHLTDYFSLYSRQHPVALSLHEKSAPKHNATSKQEPDKFQVYFCETEEKICPKEYRVQPRALYSKMQQKKVSRGGA